MRAIATDNRFISSWVMCFMTSAAAVSPIDSITTADFSRSDSPSCTSGRLFGSLKSASVTGYPPSDDLRRARRVIGDQRLHGFGFDAKDVLRLAPRPRQRPRRAAGNAAVAPPVRRNSRAAEGDPGAGGGEDRRLNPGHPAQQGKKPSEQRQETSHREQGILLDASRPRFPPPRPGRRRR